MKHELWPMNRDFSCCRLNGCSTWSRFFCRGVPKNDFVNSIWKTISLLIVSFLPCASSSLKIEDFEADFTADRAVDAARLIVLLPLLPRLPTALAASAPTTPPTTVPWPDRASNHSPRNCSCSISSNRRHLNVVRSALCPSLIH